MMVAERKGIPADPGKSRSLHLDWLESPSSALVVGLKERLVGWIFPMGLLWLTSELEGRLSVA